MIFLHHFGCAKDLTVSILIDADCDKDRYVLYFSVLAAFEIYTVNVYVSIVSGERTAAPFFNVLVCLLIKVADCIGGYARSP